MINALFGRFLYLGLYNTDIYAHISILQNYTFAYSYTDLDGA